FVHASATAMPFEAGSFDGALLLHVGMNIPDKEQLFRELARVVRPGGFLGVYEIMRGADGELAYPVPWASSPETSFLETPERYAELAQAAGFDVVSTRDRREFGIEFFAKIRARAEAGGGAPVLGPHLVMGADAPVKVANMVRAMEERAIAPTELVATRSSRHPG
ncbi:MAG TPA: methyltransferase domain-containing protein, partial [Sandaracinaceae bacterium]